MTIRFDRVSTCDERAAYVVEGYTPKGGLAHGSLDVTVRTCIACHGWVRKEMEGRGVLAYSVPLTDGQRCGGRMVFEENAYTQA